MGMFEFINMTAALGCSVEPTLMANPVINQANPYRSVQMAVL